jgi:peptide/nickel transport system permease protein
MAALRGGDLDMAGRAVGASPMAVALRHLIPQAGPVIAVAAALRFADTVLLESVLSFLGLAAPPPAVSLGTIVASGSDALGDAWWVALPPGIVLATLVVLVRSWSSGLLAAADPPSSA